MTDQEIDRSDELRMLRDMLNWPDKQHIRDILLRRIFAIEQDIVFTNPFGAVDETLYDLWKGSNPQYQEPEPPRRR